MSKFNLGDEAKDKITGFQGILTGYAEYLTGCNQYVLQPKCEATADKYPEGQWFDEGRIELVGNALTKDDVKGEKNGACGCAPIK